MIFASIVNWASAMCIAPDTPKTPALESISEEDEPGEM